jgi:hypothetical protein
LERGRAQGDDLRTFLGDFVAALTHIEFSATELFRTVILSRDATWNLTFCWLFGEEEFLAALAMAVQKPFSTNC